MNANSSSSNRPSQTSSFKLVAVFLLLALCTVTMMPSAWSQETAATPPSEGTEGGSASTAGMQAAAGLSTLLYLPLKLAFAIGGGVVGGLAYAFSGGNEQAAKSIWTTSLYGTYIITPDHLEGNRPIRFLGVADANDAPAPAPAPAPEPIR
ncbi:MAG: hypothetical protein KGS09_04440 [Nitrospirae bacterium]|nr:hypothetical protein [Nitrospirota bacterium]MDE3049165.1 hypothetical protein [Nitrospirota bacterium]MDE3220255.1 hypothetical protein [Nitrospirota bacterium]